jgi:REP element-mobilizing transposase RayT
MKRQVIRIFFKALTETIEKYNILVHHVVLMSNHYHIIATATDKNLDRAMQYLNSRVAVRYNKLSGQSGHLWGDRYKSCIISTDEHYTASVRYIYRNPKRANMVDNLEDFLESSFQFWAFGKKMEVALTEDHLVLLWGKSKDRSQNFFQTLVLDDGACIPDDTMKKSLRGLFLGPADFIRSMQETHLIH